MFCTKCGTNNPDGVSFCTVCGTKLGGTQGAPAVQNQPAQQFTNPEPQVQSELVDNDEKIVADLRNGYLMNFLGGEALKTEKAYITNKRLYYMNKISFTNTTEEIIDLEDITGTKITRFNPIGFIVLAVIAVLFGIVSTAISGSPIGILPGIFGGLFFILLFFITRKSFLTIEYAGGKVFFSVKGYSLQNIRSFQRAIYYYKQLLKNGK